MSRPLLASLLTVLLLAGSLGSLLPVSAYHDSSVEGPHAIAEQVFQRTWARTDDPVASLRVQRTWMWGPEPYTAGIVEEYDTAPGGTRIVQYFDKSRMEDNRYRGSDPWDVTNGLLVVEMMDGRIQTGDGSFVDHPLGASTENIAGDPGDTDGPTYATFASLRAVPAATDGATLNQRVSRAGVITVDTNLNVHAVTAAQRVTEPGIDHQIASPFWAFMNATGLVREGDGERTDKLFLSPYYATGYPITEAYWATVKVGGTYRDVLMQCFERRCLTYTPDNEPTWQVEAGNVGQHYYRWRYESALPEQIFYADLSGDQEVPAIEHDGFGRATFLLTDDGATLRFVIELEGVENITAAHIHDGASGTTGPVLVHLFASNPPASPATISGELTSASLPANLTLAGLVQRMSAGTVYVNVHTADWPDGAVRGQVLPLEDTALITFLSGDQEVPPVASDAFGLATFIYLANERSIAFIVQVEGLTNITAAHIHWGTAGTNGPPVANLYTPATPQTVLEFDGMLTAGDILGELTLEQLVFGMLTGQTYINVHTSAHPNGEIRGQIGLFGLAG
jgi:hypothetical protein